MALIKAIVGALLGGIVASFIQTKVDMSWSVLLVGLLAGIGARLACGANRTFLTGLIAAIAAIAAVMGSSYMKSMATIGSAGDVSQPAISQEDWEARMAEDEGEEDEATNDEGGSEEVEEDKEEPAPPIDMKSFVVTPKYERMDSGAMSPWDLLLNCLSPLLAFLLAAGSSTRGASHTAAPDDRTTTAGKSAGDAI